MIKAKLKKAFYQVKTLNSTYKDLITIAAILSSFIYNYYKTEKLDSIYSKEKKAIEDRLILCESTKAQDLVLVDRVLFLEQERKKDRNTLKAQKLEIDALHLSAIMYASRHPDDTLYKAALEALLSPIDYDTIFENGKFYKK